MKKNKQLKAFTLVELMTVIFIIAVLIALSVPVLNGIRRVATEARSRSNLKEYGVGLNQFLADNRGNLPGTDTSVARLGSDGSIELKSGSAVGTLSFEALALKDHERSWAHKEGRTAVRTRIDYFIADYIGGDISANWCPTANLDVFDEDSPLFKGKYWSDTFQDWQHDTRQTGYALNAALAGAYHKDFPGETIAFIERDELISWGWTIRGGSPATWAMDSGTIRNPKLQAMGANKGQSKSDDAEFTDVAFRHRGGAHYVALDGRVSWVHSNAVENGNSVITKLFTNKVYSSF